MTSIEYRALLKTLELTQANAAALLGVDDRTSQRWALGERKIPPPASRFLRYLAHIGADPEAVWHILGDEAEASETPPGLNVPCRPPLDLDAEGRAHKRA